MSECYLFTDGKDPRAHASPLHWILCGGFRIGAGIFTTAPDIYIR
jgi:hypothetical protein